MRTDALHELIHSLSPNERRYFKLHSLPGGGDAESNSMRIFEVLLAQPSYDEAALKLAFAHSPIAKHLSSEKSYLYQLILRSLRSMGEEGDHRTMIRVQIENAILLFERGLYIQCQKALRRGRKLCEETENHLYLLEILVWERRLWKILNDKGRKEIADDLIRGQLGSLEKLLHTYQYYNLYDRMFLLTQQKFSLQEQPDHPELQAILADPLLHDIAKADSFEARHFYWQCQAWRHQLTGNQEQLYHAFSESVAWWEAHPVMQRNEATRYISTLSNLLHAATVRGSYDEFPPILAKIRATKAAHHHGDVQVLNGLYYYELLYCLNKADWECAVMIAKEIVAFLNRVGNQIPFSRRIAFHYNLSILSFVLEDYSAALKWVNAIVDESGPEIREDIQHFARILVILLHFELGNWELLEYLHRSTYRYLFNRQQLNPYAKRLMETLKRLMDRPETIDQAQELRSLRRDLDQLTSDEKSSPGLNELYCWIDSKLHRQSMRVTMGERLRPATAVTGDGG